MNVEIIEFFPMEHDEERCVLTGTLRVRLPDVGIDILGVYISKKKDRWMFSLPGRRSISHKTGLPVNYPALSFIDREKQAELMFLIREKGRDFVEKRLLDKENPIVLPVKKESEVNEIQHVKASDIKPEDKESVPLKKPEPKQSIAGKVWIDPPRRTPTAAKKRF